MMRYLTEQGLIATTMPIDDFFVPVSI